MAPTLPLAFSRWHRLWSFPQANGLLFPFPFLKKKFQTKLFTFSHSSAESQQLFTCWQCVLTFGSFWSCSRYNYDVAKDAPMDGRYEWVRVGPWHDRAHGRSASQPSDRREEAHARVRFGVDFPCTTYRLCNTSLSCNYAHERANHVKPQPHYVSGCSPCNLAFG